MKKLGKVLKTAEVTALLTFLRVYRETPHSSTGVAPAVLLMGFGRSSGIPQVSRSPIDPDFLTRANKLAQENDRKAKERMKLEFDKRMRETES